MSTEPKVHQGWTVSTKTPGKRLEYAARHREKQQFISEPFHLSCSPAGITEEQWAEVENWVEATAPHKSARIRVNIGLYCFCSEVELVLRLNLSGAGEEFSTDQRSRINQSLSHHRHIGESMQLTFTLRQVLRPD